MLHGDMVMDLELGTCVLRRPNSCLSCKELRITRLGLGSAEDGVLDNNGKPILEITLRPLRLSSTHKGSGSTDVTGGMLGKV